MNSWSIISEGLGRGKGWVQFQLKCYRQQKDHLGKDSTTSTLADLVYHFFVVQHLQQPPWGKEGEELTHCVDIRRRSPGNWASVPERQSWRPCNMKTGQGHTLWEAKVQAVVVIIIKKQTHTHKCSIHMSTQDLGQHLFASLGTSD